MTGYLGGRRRVMTHLGYRRNLFIDLAIFRHIVSAIKLQSRLVMQLLRVEAALDDPEICTLADLIYAAVFDDSLWTTVLSKIADLVDAGPGILVR